MFGDLTNAPEHAQVAISQAIVRRHSEAVKNPVDQGKILPPPRNTLGKTWMAQDPSDFELSQRLAKGDPSAFPEVVQQHGRYLFTIARSLTPSNSDAEDVVQEVFLALFRSKFRGESKLRTFLVSILMRQAALLRRKHKPWMRLAGSEEALAEAEASASVRSETPAIDAKVDLAELLGRLSPEHREVVILRELEGLSYDEIAQTLSIAKGTVESRLYRARESLQQIAARVKK